MKIRLLIGTAAIAILVMAGLATGEKLQKEDGKVAAMTLPLDASTAKTKFETATFGLGWFWGPDSEFGSLKGVLRTRVGYCGGEKDHPTYYSLGNHTEAISIDYDPKVISYEDLLKLFWSAHRCDQNNTAVQYMNAIFYQNDIQKKLAETSVEEAAKRRGVTVAEVETQIVPVRTFTYAEEYHQKYYLIQNRSIRNALSEVYPDGKSLADSTVATRINAYLGTGMRKDWKAFLKDIPQFGLPEKYTKALTEIAQAQIKP